MMLEYNKWKNSKEYHKEALFYLNERRKGRITSFKTPWTKINEASVNGIEWKSTVIIGARPATGKTTFKDQLIYNGFNLNPEQEYKVLDFSLEMVGRTSAIRSYSPVLGKSYTDLCSANTPLSKEEYLKLIDYAKNISEKPIYIIDEPPTVEEFEMIVEDFMRENVTVTPNDEFYTNTIVSIDHSILLKNRPGQNKNDMLYELGETVTKLKKKYPIIFMILSQLNRDVNRPERNENGKYGNYVLDSDIFGSDALLQHADYVFGLNRPGIRKITNFGPEMFIIEDKDIIVCHHLKSRNGETGMSFYRAEFNRMRLVDIPPPPQAQKRK